jgi:hypothetical protein
LLVIANGTSSMPGDLLAAHKAGGEVEGVFNPPSMMGVIGEDGRDWTEDMATSADASSILVGGRACNVLVVVNGVFPMPGNLQVACGTWGGVEGVFNPPPMAGAIGEGGRDGIEDMTMSSLTADADSV